MQKKVKICLACSVGGHLTQIQQLNKLYREYDYFFITEDILLTKELGKTERVYYIKLINRRRWDFIYLLCINTIRTLLFLIKEKPDFIISTGALSVIPACLIGKMLGKKLIFIESFAKMETPTLTGQLVYRFSDLFIVQWEKLLEFYPKAIYGGSIY